MEMVDFANLAIKNTIECLKQHGEVAPHYLFCNPGTDNYSPIFNSDLESVSTGSTDSKRSIYISLRALGMEFKPGGLVFAADAWTHVYDPETGSYKHRQEESVQAAYFSHTEQGVMVVPYERDKKGKITSFKDLRHRKEDVIGDLSVAWYGNPM